VAEAAAKAAAAKTAANAAHRDKEAGSLKWRREGWQD